MNWVVIIRVRASVNSQQAVTEAMQSIVVDLENSPVRPPSLAGIAQYTHLTIETDATLAMEFSGEAITDQEAGLVEHLVASLNEFGLVEQAIWMEGSKAIFVSPHSSGS